MKRSSTESSRGGHYQSPARAVSHGPLNSKPLNHLNPKPLVAARYTAKGPVPDEDQSSVRSNKQVQGAARFCKQV